MEPSLWNIYSAILVQCTAVFIQIIVIFIYIHSSIKLYHKKGAENVSIGTELLNITALLTLFIQSIIWSLNYLGMYSILHIHCDYAIAAGYLLYLYHSAQLYCIYMTRLHSAYNNTQFQLNKCVKLILWSAILLYILICTFIVYIEIFHSTSIVQTIDFTNMHIRDKATTICWGKPSSTLIFISFALMSFLFSSITLILFIRPLFKIFKRSAVSMDNVDLIQVSSKYIVLTFLMIASNTMAGIGHTILEIPFIAGLCVSFNSILIILYEGRFVKYYNCLCPFINQKVRDISKELQHSIKRDPDIPITVRRVLSASAASTRSNRSMFGMSTLELQSNKSEQNMASFNVSVPELCSNYTDDPSAMTLSPNLTPATTNTNRTSTRASSNMSAFSTGSGSMMDYSNVNNNSEHSEAKLAVVHDAFVTPRPSSFAFMDEVIQEEEEEEDNGIEDIAMEELFDEILGDVDNDPSIDDFDGAHYKNDLALNAENLSNMMFGGSEKIKDHAEMDDDEKELERIEREILDL